VWPDIRIAFGWVHQAAAILANTAEQVGAEVRATYTQLTSMMREQQAQAGVLAPAIDHFLKVTQSYAPGLFQCYDIGGLPRTNNDLEQVFGSLRQHERRATGRKAASPALVVRGSARIMAVVVTRQRPRRGEELRPHDLDQWRAVREQLEYRHQARRAQRRFRQDPDAFLTMLEEQLLSASLPA
jgi:hypothetical protein